MDGYPRTKAQAEALEKITNIDKVFYFDVPEAEVIKRISGRRSCKNCGAVYHLEHKPPQTKSKCDSCGGELFQRNDDREEIVKTRFEAYRKSTAPLISYYDDKGILVRIDGTQAIDKVTSALLAAAA